MFGLGWSKSFQDSDPLGIGFGHPKIHGASLYCTRAREPTPVLMIKCRDMTGDSRAIRGPHGVSVHYLKSKEPTPVS